MKSVMISIKPKYCELIASGKKTVEVRKTRPKIETPFKCYIYCTKEKQQYLQSRSNMFFYLESKDFIGGHGAGLAGERSGLFMEQLRIIKEMRRADLERGRTGKDTRPRYMVWENVPGAFSSNKGADFSIVLQETAKVACEQAPAVPIPKNGWPPAGCLTDVGGQWSIAWRVFDAQFWGTPQRRKRLALVADFGGLTAPEILFERKGVPGNTQPCGKERQSVTRNTKNGTDSAGREIIILEHHPSDGRLKIAEDGIVQTLRAGMGHGGTNGPLIMFENHQFGGYKEGCGTIKASGGSCGGGSENLVVDETRYTIRRLTPLECERLQGFPDGWTDIGEWTDSKGKVHKESTDRARYKALGNSIAIPPWTYVLQRLSLCCGAKPTMASLFDGIGGFPYIWESLNGKGSCVWASEIEDFPIAVTKYHFPEEVTNDG